MRLTLTKPDGSDITIASTFIGSGLFKATYAIPRTGLIGTYSIVALAHAANVQDASAVTTFEVKPTWLSAQGPALTTAAAATAPTRIGARSAGAWKKGGS